MKFISVLMFCFVAGLSAHRVRHIHACPSGWVSSGKGLCYEFNNVARPWLAAKLDCEHKGGWLVEVEDETKASHLRSIRYSLGMQNRYYWIGAKQNSPGSRDFSWVSGHAFSTSLWYPGDPNNLVGGDSCVDMASAAQQMKMCDWPCRNALPYICEMWIFGH